MFKIWTCARPFYLLAIVSNEIGHFGTIFKVRYFKIAFEFADKKKWSPSWNLKMATWCGFTIVSNWIV